MKAKGYFRTKTRHDHDYLDFDHDSEQISATNLTLNKKETKQFFLSMYNCYCAKKDKFWEISEEQPKGECPQCTGKTDGKKCTPCDQRGL